VNFLPVVFYSILYAAINVSGAALIKSDLKAKSLESFTDYFLFLIRWRVVAGFALVFLSAIILIKALSIAKISLVNPMATGINFGFTLIAGYFVFNERIGLPHYLGLAFILCGILIISIAERSSL
jgi:multidrug transporter EmrE-like cation transporter